MPVINVVFDLGANFGQNLRYFLNSADRVIAVEANPIAASFIKSHFSEFIEEGRLSVIHGIVSSEMSSISQNSQLSLWVPLDSSLSVLATAIEPDNTDNFLKIDVPSVRIHELMYKHMTLNSGITYVKIDLEGMDIQIIQSLMKHRIYPELISFEVHSSEALRKSILPKRYRCFKIVEGDSVHTMPGFEHGCSGPTWYDIPEPCGSRFMIKLYLLFAGLGWKDVHASSVCGCAPKLLSVVYIRKMMIRLGIRIRRKFKFEMDRFLST